MRVEPVYGGEGVRRADRPRRVRQVREVVVVERKDLRSTPGVSQLCVLIDADAFVKPVTWLQFSKRIRVWGLGLGV